MHLRAISSAFPSEYVATETVAQWVGMDPAFIINKVGIAGRFFMSSQETVLTLSKTACDNLFASNPDLRPDAVKLLIVVTQNPDYKLPHTSALLQHALGLATDVACFDISLGCSGYVYALSIAKSFMLAEGINEALVVTSDPYSKIIGKKDRDTVTIFGDAATATWMSLGGSGVLGKMDWGTDGARAHTLMVPAGGSAHPVSSVWNANQTVQPSDDFRLKMDGRAIFNFMMEKVPQSVNACLEKNDTTLDAVDYFVFHQANRFFLDQLQKKMGLPAAKVPCNVHEVGNTVSSSIPLLLSRLLQEGKLRNRSVLVSGFGVGLSWATNLIFFGGAL